jgi:hypothetical protein
VNSPIRARASLFLSAAHEPTPMERAERHFCLFREEESTRRLPQIDKGFQFRDKSNLPQAQSLPGYGMPKEKVSELSVRSLGGRRTRVRTGLIRGAVGPACRSRNSEVCNFLRRGYLSLMAAVLMAIPTWPQQKPEELTDRSLEEIRMGYVRVFRRSASGPTGPLLYALGYRHDLARVRTSGFQPGWAEPHEGLPPGSERRRAEPATEAG